MQPTRPPGWSTNPRNQNFNIEFRDGPLEDWESEINEDETYNESGLEYLKENRIIPAGRGQKNGLPIFIKYPKVTEATYNVFAWVGGMGSGKSSFVRSIIYYTYKFDDTIHFIFDPMRLEFSSLSRELKPGSEEWEDKLAYLPNDNIEEGDKIIHLKILPDHLKVFHVIPRFALYQQEWDVEKHGYIKSIDKMALSKLHKDGGFVFAEDISRMSEERLFGALNFSETINNNVLHSYLRTALRICNERFGDENWFIQDLIQVLRDNVKQYMNAAEQEDLEDDEVKDKVKTRYKTQLSTNELRLIEQLEKYNSVGFFVRNIAERKRFTLDFRKLLEIGRIINISFLGFRKTEQIGEDLVKGQADLLMERMIEVSKEYYYAVEKVRDKIPITKWEQFLIDKWKVSIWMEESEIFAPRDIPKLHIKKYPCIKRLDFMMSYGRKYGFKNFGFVTQRTSKMNQTILEESTKMFIGQVSGKDRDDIMRDFSVLSEKLNMSDDPYNEQLINLKEIVATLNKSKHEWVIIDKGSSTINIVAAYDSPCG